MWNKLNSVVGWIALVVALGGTALAATRLPAASVGTRQLRPRAVTRAKIAAGSVDARRLSPKVVRAIAAQTTINTVVVRGGSLPTNCSPAMDCSSPAGTAENYSVPCPAGTTLLSGGYLTSGAHTEVIASMPDQDGKRWDVTVRLSADATEPPTAVVNVLCAKLGS
jgi:hypothetical protein